MTLFTGADLPYNDLVFVLPASVASSNRCRGENSENVLPRNQDRKLGINLQSYRREATIVNFRNTLNISF